MTLVRRFLGFWYDFLVGDRWELFLGPVAALVVVWVLICVGIDPATLGLLLFAFIVLVGAMSIYLRSRLA